MSEKTKVAIAGINGKMGRCSLAAVAASSNHEIVSAFGRAKADYVGDDLSSFLTEKKSKSSFGVKVSNDLQASLAAKPDVLLEFTHAEAALNNALECLKNSVRPLIGTSGLSEDEFKRIDDAAKEHDLPAMVIPNFSVGAVLMMEFAKQAGIYFENVEILEMHGPKKLDAPSGTATYTAKKLAETGRQFNPKVVDERQLLDSVRGGVTDSGVRIHSMRLPGLISQQDVMFGAPGELLSIRHNSFNTDCFLKGIILSIDAIMEQKPGLLIGLEKLL